MSQPAAETEENENGKDSDKKPKKKKSYWKFFVGLLVVILLILAFTNPGRDTHKQAVKEEVGKVIDKATNSLLTRTASNSSRLRHVRL